MMNEVAERFRVLEEEQVPEANLYLVSGKMMAALFM
jgi:hypothetical protein